MASLRESKWLCCPKCSEQFRDPRVLPVCGHTICRACLEEWVKKYRADMFTCPECKTTVKLDKKGVAGLPKNAALVKALEGKKDCLEHQKQLDLYCKPCGKVICSLCLVKGAHVKHDALDIMDKYKESTADLSDLKEKLSLRSSETRKQQSQIAKVVNSVKDAGRKRKTDIKKQFDDLRKELNEREVDLFKEIDKHCEEAEKMGEELKSVLEEILSSIQEIDDLIKLEPVMLLQNLKDLKKRCLDTMETQQTQPTNMKLPECSLESEATKLAIRCMRLKWKTAAYADAQNLGRKVSHHQMTAMRDMSKWTPQNVVIKKERKKESRLIWYYLWYLSPDFVKDLLVHCGTTADIINRYLSKSIAVHQFESALEAEKPRLYGDTGTLDKAVDMLMTFANDIPEDVQKRLSAN